MSTPEREPMSPDLEALLAAERGVDVIDEATAARVSGAVLAGIGALPGGGGGGASGSPSRGPSQGPGPATSVASSTTAAAKGLAGAKLAAALFVAAGAGVLTGVGADRALSPQAPPVAIQARAAEPPAAPQPAPSTMPVEALSALVAPAARPAPSATTHAPAEPSAKGLAAERALLDVARSGLAQGDPATALRACEQHAHEYPDGALGEERDAMRVKALAALGRTAEAKRRATEFEARYPESLQLRAVRAAVE